MVAMICNPNCNPTAHNRSIRDDTGRDGGPTNPLQTRYESIAPGMSSMIALSTISMTVIEKVSAASAIGTTAAIPTFTPHPVAGGNSPPEVGMVAGGTYHTGGGYATLAPHSESATTGELDD